MLPDTNTCMALSDTTIHQIEGTVRTHTTCYSKITCGRVLSAIRSTEPQIRISINPQRQTKYALTYAATHQYKSKALFYQSGDSSAEPNTSLIHKKQFPPRRASKRDIVSSLCSTWTEIPWERQYRPLSQNSCRFIWWGGGGCVMFPAKLAGRRFLASRECSRIKGPKIGTPDHAMIHWLWFYRHGIGATRVGKSSLFSVVSLPVFKQCIWQ